MLLDRLGRQSARHHRLVIALWILAVVLVSVGKGVVGHPVVPKLVKVYKNVTIVSLATNLLGLAVWTGVLARILIQKDKLWGLVFICCLMIIF